MTEAECSKPKSEFHRIGELFQFWGINDKKNSFLLHEQKDEMGRKAPTPKYVKQNGQYCSDIM